MTKIAHNTKSKFGFTLVELLVVIAIIATLSVIGVVVFKNVSSSARDSRRKADIQSIAKAYESQYSGTYQTVLDSHFAEGKIPMSPEGGSYYNNLTTDHSSFRVCAALENNPQRICSSPSQNCYCASSAQGSYQPQPGNGIPPDPPSCDPNGTLSYGLIGWWKMDEASWIVNCSTGSVIDSSNNGNNGKACPNSTGPAGGAVGKSGNAGSFDGIDDTIDTGNSTQFQTTTGTWSVWLYLRAAPAAGSGNGLLAYTDSNGDYNNVTALKIQNNRTIVVTNRVGAEAWPFRWEDASSTVIPLNQWTHLALVQDGAAPKLYINGDLNLTVNSGNALAAWTSAQSQLNFRINYPVGDGYINGIIDDVRVYNRALSNQEIQTIYNGCI